MAMENDVAAIKQTLLKIEAEKFAPSKPQVMGCVELNAANPVLVLNSSYYYDITLKLKLGMIPVQIFAWVQLVTEQTPDPSPMYLDSSQVQWKIKGVRCNQVFVDPNAIKTAHVVVGYIGYDKPENIALSI